MPSEEFREGVLQREPREIAVAVIVDGDAVLVTRRDGAQHLGGHAEFPGGHREPGESLEQCAVREAREEVGLEVRVVRRLATARHEDERRRLLLTFFECACVGGREPSSAAVTQRGARWVPRSELATLPFPPANAAVVRAITATPA